MIEERPVLFGLAVVAVLAIGHYLEAEAAQPAGPGSQDLIVSFRAFAHAPLDVDGARHEAAFLLASGEEAGLLDLDERAIQEDPALALGIIQALRTSAGRDQAL